jgi:beta-mannanase
MRLGKRLAVAAVAVATGALSLAAAGAMNADATSWSCTVSTDTQCPGSGVYPSPGETAGSNSSGVAVIQNEWGANSNLTSQVLSANSGSAWQVTANLSASNKAVLSYPDTQEVVTNSSGDPTPLADYDTLTSSYTDALPSSPGASDDYEAAYDLWLGAGTVSGSQEIMVWTDNHGQTPSGSDTGKTWTDASTGDVYEIWASSPGNPVSLVAKTNATSGSVDLLTMIKWLKTNSYITSTGLNQIDYGFELCSTSGAPETFSVSAYSISATGDGTNGAPGGGTAPTGPSGSGTPVTQLGIYTTAEADSGTYSTEAGQTPDVGNYYLPYGSSYPSTFASAVSAAGATPFMELEPWEQGQGSDTCSADPSEPSMTTIGANGSSVQSYLKGLGSAVASAGKPVIFTFAHEFNYDGQYPWSQGNCEGTTAAQWIAAWDAVRNDVDSTADGLASFMWVPNIYYSGGAPADISPAAYWPGAANVDMVGVDGYPSGAESFSSLFEPSFSIIDGLSGESTIPQPSIFIAETNFEPLGSGIASMVQDICTEGGDGTLQFLYQEPDLTSSEWSALDSATSTYCPASTGGGGGSKPLASVSAATSVTSTTATINGSVNPEGLATTYQFGYGTSANYNEFSPASPASAGSGTSNEAESATITGLTPSTTYHFAIEAINSDGTTESSDDTFTTAASGGLTEAPTTAPNGPSLSGGTTTSISWNIPSADTATADKWSYFELLVLGTEGAVQHDVDVSTNSATMYLSPAGERYFKVRACNADGCSAYSPSVGYDN